MLVEVESISVAKPDLEKIIIKTFFWNAHLFCSFFKRILFSLSGLITSSRVVFSPLDYLFNNVTDPPLFCTSALFFALSRDLRFLVFTRLFSLVLNVADGALSIHQSVNIQQSQIFGFDVEKSIQADLFEVNEDVLADRENSTSNEDFTFW